MDERTQFYLNNGWLTPRMASIAGMYEDGEGIREELERLDILLGACRIAFHDAGTSEDGLDGAVAKRLFDQIGEP